MHGGRATSSRVLPYVGASASEVKALPGIVVTLDRSGRTGRPATVFTFRSDSSRREESAPADRTVMESDRAKVVRIVPTAWSPHSARSLRPGPPPRTRSAPCSERRI